MPPVRPVVSKASCLPVLVNRFTPIPKRRKQDAGMAWVLGAIGRERPSGRRSKGGVARARLERLHDEREPGKRRGPVTSRQTARRGCDLRDGTTAIAALVLAAVAVLHAGR